MELLERIMQRAKENLQRIVLPEGTEPRTLEAANIILADKTAKIILIGDENQIMEMAQEKGLDHIKNAEIINPAKHNKIDEYTNLLFKLRKEKGLTFEGAQNLVKDPLYLACLMIKNGDADGELAGALNTTGDVLRPAFQIVKTKPGTKIVSGAILMFTPATELGENGVFVFADCAVNINPSAEELASIALSTAETTEMIAGFKPKVAMLSFSSKGSAKHELADKVIQATQIAKEKNPTLQIDGELQADAAIIKAIGKSKAPQSNVAGEANVLVFPDLQSGNIGYKLVERLSGAKAIGPILQGISAPINDLSRGCSVEDIVRMITITAIQAIKE